jgi:hypothetical protein
MYCSLSVVCRRSLRIVPVLPFPSYQGANQTSTPLRSPAAADRSPASHSLTPHRPHLHVSHSSDTPFSAALLASRGSRSISSLASHLKPRRHHLRSSDIFAMDGKGDMSAKRKRSTTACTSEHPNKQLRPEPSILTPDDATPANGTVYEIEEDVDEAPSPVAIPATTDSPEWQATIEKVVKCAVSIHFCQTCSFDTELSMSSQATGFVVDAERGYILTNRHVVGAGPFWGYCIFDNHEEVSRSCTMVWSKTFGY